jgi:hypothetical protein
VTEKKDRAALFQDGFAVSGKEFYSRQLGVELGVAELFEAAGRAKIR